MRLRLNVPFEGKLALFAACAILMSDPVTGTPPVLVGITCVVRSFTAALLLCCALKSVTVED